MNTHRFALQVDPDILPAIDEFRRRERDLPSRAEAIRRLVAVGLDTPPKPRFDKVAYQREYMRRRRAAAKAELLHA